ncbi:hypothetical protein BKD30_04745 [Tersicoccus phoenicis]|uniref:DUF2891 domain-containing protein n=1 Tax=Tersicoccus phoenicis TaxID=554083 RepID=A0A1R1LGQ2_9MICC|nr:DUF2891 family protein [Tersicoccus phoenicis]OMH26700.1 hypothetical protein BKD30_04745 [Tersicoccus phoenicis]
MEPDLFPHAGVRCAAIVLDNLARPYPYADHHVRRSAQDTAMPHELHPAFGTSFDWHSCVHMHWLGVSVLDAGLPDSAADARLRAALGANLTAEKLDVEAEYLAANPSWERPYGWAWLVRLAAACSSSHDAELRAWGANLTGCVDTVARLVTAWLNTAEYPVRHGLHTNSAFGLAWLVDAFRTLNRDEAAAACAAGARRWFAGDAAWASEWELSGQDFLSAGLSEADLMARVLSPTDFAGWFRRFLPDLDAGSAMLAPVGVSDETDGYLVHLHGLNLSRAGQLARILAVLREAEAAPSDGHHTPSASDLLTAAVRPLFDAGMRGLDSGNFMSTHWLASFAWDAAESIAGTD